MQTFFGLFRNKTKDSSPLLIVRKHGSNSLVKVQQPIEEAFTEPGADQNNPAEKPNVSMIGQKPEEQKIFRIKNNELE